MSAQQSEDFKAFGRIFELLRLVVNAVLALAGERVDEELTKVRQNPKLAEAIAQLIVGWGKGGASMASNDLKLLASGVAIAATKAYRVANRFKRVAWRDPDLDHWLTKDGTAVNTGNAVSYRLEIDMTFVKMVQRHLGMTGAAIDALAKTLIDRGMTFSLPQIESLLVAVDQGSNPFDLRTDGYANFFFVESSGEIFVVYARRHAGGWHVRLSRFGYAGRWASGDLALFRNSNS